MDIKVSRTQLDEAECLWKIQKEAFQPDLDKYQDFETSPATEPLKYFVHRILNSHHYSVYVGDDIAGGINIIRFPQSHCRLHQIYIKPSLQNKGLGTLVIKQIEKYFPTAKKWSLYTPEDNLRNHHFYEKLGFKKTNELKVNEKLTLIEFVKLM
jgi:ribosomal protein S18 acetylase RimI-like enzyme